MPLSNATVANYSADVVAVFDQNFNQVFSGARPMKLNVNRQKKLMEHPVETGVIITDHVVILPIEIELSMLLAGIDFRSVYNQISQLFTNSTLLTVQTRTGSFSNLLIGQMPHDENPDMYSAVPLALKVKQVQFVSATYGTLPAKKVKKKANASTVAKGEQQPRAVPQTAAAELLDDAKKWVTKAPK